MYLSDPQQWGPSMNHGGYTWKDGRRRAHAYARAGHGARPGARPGAWGREKKHCVRGAAWCCSQVHRPNGRKPWMHVEGPSMVMAYFAAVQILAKTCL